MEEVAAELVNINLRDLHFLLKGNNRKKTQTHKINLAHQPFCYFMSNTHFWDISVTPSWGQFSFTCLVKQSGFTRIWPVLFCPLMCLLLCLYLFWTSLEKKKWKFCSRGGRRAGHGGRGEEGTGPAAPGSQPGLRSVGNPKRLVWLVCYVAGGLVWWPVLLLRSGFLLKLRIWIASWNWVLLWVIKSL